MLKYGDKHRSYPVISINRKTVVTDIGSNNPNNDVYKKLKSIKFKSKIYFIRYDKEIILGESKNIHIEIPVGLPA